VKDPARRGVLGEDADDLRHLARREAIVGVQDAHDRAAAGGKAAVEGPGLTLPLPVDRGDAPPEAGDHRAGVVGRAVVDHDDLDPGMGLGQRALDGLTQELAVVVVVDQDAR
jgi:hypothetical protein